MNKLQVLSITRSIISESIINCSRGEYKVDVIVNLHNNKLNNLVKVVDSSITNRSEKVKIVSMINKNKLTKGKNTDYSLILSELKNKQLNLPSAIDFMKRA